MLNRDQAQNVAEGSTAIQAGGHVTVTNAGLTYADVRDVALDVFRANFYHLSATASTIAVTRAEEMTEKFFERLLKENPSGLSKSNDPDFQYALLTAQREYARSGDKDLGDVLIDLLVDRSKQNERDILQIVLNESLTVVPKLTEGQLAILALVFLFRYTRDLTTLNPETLGKYFDTYASPFVAKAPSNNASYQHLEFTGCGAISMGEIHLEAILGDHYRGLFQQGFDAGELSTRSIIIGSDNNGLFMRSFYDSTKLQLNAMSQEVLSSKFGEYNISPADNTKITALFDETKMNDPEIKERCILIRPYMKDLFHLWSNSGMKNLSLTSVGIAIGHANVKRLIGIEFAKLSIWIN